MEYKREDLVKVAKREKNSKRPYLYVNPMQGKHIPVSPRKVMQLCQDLAQKIRESHPSEKILLIGFAETATAIATGVALHLKQAVYFQCTTRENKEKAEFIFFTESHSHATEQKLDVANYKYILEKIDRVVFIEDEVTTGNTISKLIQIMQKKYTSHTIKYTIASILNSMSFEREKELMENGIPCIYLLKLPFEYGIDRISQITYEEDGRIEKKKKTDVFIIHNIRCYMDHRTLCAIEHYRTELEHFAETVFEKEKDHMQGKILILGTEELMYPAIYLGNYILDRKENCDIKVHATTRSPILPSKAEGYPLYKRNQLKSVYKEDRITYVYNLEPYDYVIIVSDTYEMEGFHSIWSALEENGCNSIVIYNIWRR